MRARFPQVRVRLLLFQRLCRLLAAARSVSHRMSVGAASRQARSVACHSCLTRRLPCQGLLGSVVPRALVMPALPNDCVFFVHPWRASHQHPRSQRVSGQLKGVKNHRDHASDARRPASCVCIHLSSCSSTLAA